MINSKNINLLTYAKVRCTCVDWLIGGVIDMLLLKHKHQPIYQ